MNAVTPTSTAPFYGLKDIPIPIPGTGEVLVELHYAALNHLDLWTIRSRNEDIVLGSDGAGIIHDTGAGVDRSLIGKQVMINPGIGWGNDPRIASDSFDILGTYSKGTLAAFVCVPQENVFEIPSYLSMKEAAAIPMAGVTAFRALFTKARLTQSDRVLITGIGGGVALFLLQFAVAAGAEVYVTSSSDEKIQKATSLGAAGGFNYTSGDWVAQAKSAGGFDVIIDSAAGNGFAALTEVAAPAARIVLFGRTAGEINHLNPGIIFNKQLSIMGTLMGTNEEFRAMLAYCSSHAIQPVIDSAFPLSNITAAFDRLTDHSHFGKVRISLR